MRRLDDKIRRHGLDPYTIRVPVANTIRRMSNPRLVDIVPYYRQQALAGNVTVAKALRFARFAVAREREHDARWRAAGGYLP